MARAKDLAGIAALAGLGYMLSKKGDETGPSSTAQERGDSALRINAQKNAISGNKPKEDADNTTANAYRSGVMGGATQPSGTTTTNVASVKPRSTVASSDLPPAKLKSVSEPSDKSIKLAPEKRDLEAGMSRGTRTAPAPASTVSSSEEGMKNYKPRRTAPAPASTVSSSEEGMKNYKPRYTPPSATKSAPPAASKPAASKPATSTSSNRVPTSEQAAANRQAAYDKVKAVRSSVGDYVRNFETPAERRSREAKESSGMKRGGAVKKMASGGMTASRRADGIATRGKTRGKMY